MRARNVILTLIGLFVLAITGTAFYVLTYPERVVAWIAEIAASDLLQTEVTIDSIDLRWDDADELSGVSVMGLSVDNPAGFSPQPVLRIGTMEVEFGRPASPEGPGSIRELRVLSAEIYYEEGETGSNLGWLAQRWAELLREYRAADAPDSEEFRLTIGTVSSRGGQVRAGLRQLGDREVQLLLPPFELRRVGGSEGAHPTEIAAEIFSAFASRAREVLRREVGPGALRGTEWEAEPPFGGI